MATGYTRQSAGSIITGGTILAAHFNNEYNQLASAFDGTTGHDHSGGAGLGPKLSLTTAVTGLLPVANGGTNNAYFTVAGPAASAKTYTFPNASCTILTANAAVTVAQGGTGIASGTSGGLLAFTAGTTIASTAAGTSVQVLHGNGTSAPTWSSVSLTADVSGTLPVANGGTGVTSLASISTLSGLSTIGTISTGVWQGTPIGNSYLANSAVANLSGTNTGDQSDISGNANTATALANARTIGGVSFNGTANITVSSATGGFTVSGGDLAVGANSITCTGSLGSTGSRLTKGWFVDLQVTNAIAGSITGNAATVTTNANLTGDITSSGNATTIGAGKVTNAMLATANGNTVKVNATSGSASPTDLAMGASTILARLAAGNIVAATPAQLLTLLANYSPLVGNIQYTGATATTGGVTFSNNLSKNRSGTGTYAVTFGVAQADTNYHVIATGVSSDANKGIAFEVSAKTVNGFTLTVYIDFTNAATDPTTVNISVFRYV